MIMIVITIVIMISWQANSVCRFPVCTSCTRRRCNLYGNKQAKASPPGWHHTNAKRATDSTSTPDTRPSSYA